MMIFRDLLNHFNIEEEFPDYLLDQSFNRVFLDGELTRNGSSYKISIKTRQNVTHKMFISPDDEFPLIILSELPNGLLNGMKFGRREGEVKFIDRL